MKKLMIVLVVLILLISFSTPVSAAGAFQSHGTHGQGNVVQNFVGAGADPWDNPPGNEP